MTGRREMLLAAVLLSACAAGAAAQQTGGGTAAHTSRVERTRVLAQGFSVVLVLADLTASAAQDDVPPAARRALADMKDFLPFKSYKLLDAAWILGHGTGTTMTRLRGVDEQEYELRLQTSPIISPGGNSEEGRVAIRFTLSDSPGDELPLEMVTSSSEARASAELKRELDRLRAQYEEAQKRKQEAQARDLEAKMAELQQRVPDVRVQPRKFSFAGRAVVDTNFTMDIGETVVVGTSRLRGGSRALIALLTAVPPKGAVRPEAR